MRPNLDSVTVTGELSEDAFDGGLSCDKFDERIVHHVVAEMAWK